MHCSLARSLEVVGDWWTPLIIRDVYLGVNRFDDLAEDLGISRNLLTTRLQALVADGVLGRHRYSERPARYEYVLTDAGREVVPVFMALTAWGDRWFTPTGGPPLRFEHRGCGHIFTPEVHCSACGARVEAADVVARAGPGRQSGPGTRLLGADPRPRPPEPSGGVPHA
jgi:DNA-binding HxlR family transcriptional regulator